MPDIPAIQAALQQFGIDGWLLYDFRGSNPLARRVLQIPDGAMLTRRWFYFIPANGEPQKLLHRIEPAALNHVPGTAHSYLKWQQFEAGVGDLVRGAKKIAMEYVPRNANPYVSRVDAGTIELVKSTGVEIVPSGDLIQMFEACWDDKQWAMHQKAAECTTSAYDAVWQFIGERTRGGGSVRETEVQQHILDHFQHNGLTTDHPPIVGVGPHSGDPHYEPKPGSDAQIHQGDFVLVDLWAKLAQPRAVYSDLTRVAFVGETPSAKHVEVFNIVVAARDAAIPAPVRAAFKTGEQLQGWQVDRAARDVIEKAGYGDYFIHRTGHSIGEEDHGNGPNMDDLETHETRRVLPRSCFSIEPGIYLPEFGLYSEVNVYVDAAGGVHVTGGEQWEIVRIG